MSDTPKCPWLKDIRPHFVFYVPSMLKILKPTPKHVRQIESKYNGRIRMYREAIAKEGVFEAETTIFDLLWNAERGNRNSIGFLAFIEETCASLLLLVDEERIAKLQKTCFQAIMNFDGLESRFRCYVGELALLRRILSTDHLQLIDVEHKLPNGRSFDFAINLNSELYLIEVLNIFLRSELLQDEAAFQGFIEKRFIDKLESKTKGVPNIMFNFALLPIVWGDFPKLDKYIGYFQTFSPPKNIVLPPMMITSFRNVKSNDIAFTLSDVKQYLEYRDKNSNQTRKTT